MPTLWILHRDERLRAVLARLAGAGEDAVLGAPGDAVFAMAPAPGVVILGLAGDFERELEFAHRSAPHVGRAGWILLAERSATAEARRLFDTLDARVLTFPVEAGELRAEIDSLLRRRRVDTLSQRRARDALAERFARWFADLELPDLLRALDPQLSRVPLLVRGEPGTGRDLLARYVHGFGGTTGGFFVHVPCSRELSTYDVVEAIAAGGRRGRGASCVIWLQDVDTLTTPVQRRVREWVEFGPPDGSVRAGFVRWMASAGEPGTAGRRLDPGLERALSGVALRIPPLRERVAAIEPFAEETARAWCEQQGQRVRHLSPEALDTLQTWLWPGNLMELEAVVVRSLASSGADPLLAEQLRFEGEERSHRGAGGTAPLPARPPVAPHRLEILPRREVESGPPIEPFPIEPVPTPEPGVEPREELARTELEELEPALPEATPPDVLRRLAGAVAHEVRNPLAAIRTLTDILPERYDDPEFRERFAELVGSDVERIEDVVRRLGELGELGELERQPVDAVALLEQLLEEHRAEIEQRRLLVLKELDYTEPFVLGDPDALQGAVDGLMDRVLDAVPERGDLFLASRHHEAGLRGAPSLRLLLRFRGAPGAARPPGVTPLENSLDLVLAEASIRAQGGALTLDTSQPNETLLVVDLPAPA
jgi:DNA-binding NtrC family response regulator